MHIPFLLNLMKINLLIVWTTTWVMDARTIDGGRTDRRTDEQEESSICPTSSQSQLRCGGIIRIEPCNWSHKSLYILRSIISALLWSAYTLNMICYMFPNIAWIGDNLSALGKVQIDRLFKCCLIHITQCSPPTIMVHGSDTTQSYGCNR